MSATVINLWTGPGGGKSTTAALLFGLMKSRNIKCELVTEYAKELTYADRLKCRNDQLMVLAEMNTRLSRCVNDVDFVITDSPLPVGLVYGGPFYQQPWFEQAVVAVFNQYDNFNVLLERVKPYQSYGRTQSEAEARLVDGQMRSLLARLFTKDLMLAGDNNAPANILAELERHYAIPR